VFLGTRVRVLGLARLTGPCLCFSGGINLTYNYLVTDWTGETTRVSASEYESGLYASVDVMADVSEFSSANQLQIIVHMTFLDVTDSWLFGRVLADVYAQSNAGLQSHHRILEMTMGMGFPMGMGIPWDSHGNGNC